MSGTRGVDSLGSYVEAVSRVVCDGHDAEATAEAIAALNRDLLVSGFRLPDEFRRIDPDAPYTRNLVHLDSDSRFSVIVIVWGGFQETAVHDHLNWGVVSVLEQSCLALDYDRLDDGRNPEFADLRVRSAALLEPGSVTALTPPPSSNIHKMSNTGREPAISLHTYGDPGTRARVFDPATGEVTIRELVFHNA